MRYAVRVLAFALAVIWAFGAWAAGASYRLQVAGLACPFCAYGIEKQLNALEGVDEVETHIKEGAVIVIMDEGASLDQATAERAVEAAGFTLDDFARVEAP